MKCVETMLWQLEGSSVVTVKGTEIKLGKDETLLIPPRSSFYYSPDEESLTMSIVMDPWNKLRPCNN